MYRAHYAKGSEGKGSNPVGTVVCGGCTEALEVVELIRARCSVAAAGSGKKTDRNVYRPYMCYTVMDEDVVFGGYIKRS